MTEIKYRAWDKQRKEWVKQTGNPYIFPFEGRVAMICAGSSTGHISDEDYSEYYELSEYADLQDKNGIEYCQDDIFVDTRRDKFYKVIKTDGAFWGEPVFEPHEYYSRVLLCHINVLSEIIGNIYENSKLLEEPTI